MFCLGGGGGGGGGAGTRRPASGPEGVFNMLEPQSREVKNEEAGNGKEREVEQDEVDIPTPAEFGIANAAKDLRFIDSDATTTAVDRSPSHSSSVGGGTTAEEIFSCQPPQATPPSIVVEADLQDDVEDDVEDVGEDEDDDEEDAGRGSSAASTADVAALFSSCGGSSSTDSALDAADMGGSINDPVSNPCRSPAPGPRFKLLHEGDIQACRLNHSRNVIGKILGSKFLRRWEGHRLVLGEESISSKTATGIFESAIEYSQIEEIYQMARWDSSHKYCLQLAMNDGSVLLQAKNSYIRDQWFHSISWKRNLLRYKRILLGTRNDNILHRELKCFIDFVMVTPLQDECFTSGPLEIISKLLTDIPWKDDGEEIIVLSGNIIGTTTLPESLALTLGKICRTRYLSKRVRAILHHAARRILKHNVDFGKAPHLRRFLQDYISALYRSHGGHDVVRSWIGTVHGPGFNCPHPRVLPNLAAVCLAAFHSIPPLASPENDTLNGKCAYDFGDFDEMNNDDDPPAVGPNNNNADDLKSFGETISNGSVASDDCDKLCEIPYGNPPPRRNANASAEENDMLCFANVIHFMSSYPDWAESLGAVLQPVPIPAHVIQSKSALASLATAIVKLGTDDRCAVHSHILPLRPSRPGWLQILCPTYNDPEPERLQQWGEMLVTLLNCCCKRKCFLTELAKMLPACLLLALRAHPAGLESLCLMLEWEVLEDEQARVEAVQALRSTSPGRKALQASCQRQVHLKKLQQKGGPRRLTLPSCATDADVARLLSAGSFGNLECLSLAFTHVTSAVAEQLIKLPSLRYLNLWATQFGDAGVLLIVEHLHRLQVLNLCETPVSDVGIEALAALKKLKKLNLNSTKLSAATWARLQPTLPALQECDIRYTDAW